MENLPRLVASLNNEDMKRLVSLLGYQASLNSENAKEDGMFVVARIWNDISLTLHVAEEDISSLI
mgnify:CR=1 FL=1|jgi:hypothetical protein|tara:strand:- start:618 stop:812 length:195 start_codon:yes stop_codon:yes gene_type:complete